MLAGYIFWFFSTPGTTDGNVEKARFESYVKEKADLIEVENPKFLQKIKSPILITGQARGSWFFEASFPVSLVYKDDKGKNFVVSEGHADAKSEWMTNDFVPFEASLEFVRPPSVGHGYLILKKDNPSGLPEHDDQIEIPVLFE